MLGTSGDVQTLEDLSLGNPGQSSRVQAVIDIIWLMIVHLIGERNRKGTRQLLWGEGLLRQGRAAILHFSPGRNMC